MGNVMHEALESFAEEVRKRGMKWTELTEQERNEIADRCLDNIVADYGNTVLKSSARNEYMIERTRRILRRTVWALQKQLEQGVYSHCIFKLLAWTEQSLWQNSYYVEVEQLAGCRVEDWYNMLKELDIKGEKIDEAQAKSILRVCEAIYYARRSLKIDRLSKTAWKDVKELYQRIQVLVYDVYSSKCLLNCIKGNNSRALYRDSGLLIGWRCEKLCLLPVT